MYLVIFHFVLLHFFHIMNALVFIYFRAIKYYEMQWRIRDSGPKSVLRGRVINYNQNWTKKFNPPRMPEILIFQINLSYASLRYICSIKANTYALFASFKSFLWQILQNFVLELSSSFDSGPLLYSSLTKWKKL